MTVSCGLVQRAQAGSQLVAAAGTQPGERVVGVSHGERLREIQLEQK